MFPYVLLFVCLYSIGSLLSPCFPREICAGKSPPFFATHFSHCQTSICYVNIGKLLQIDFLRNLWQSSSYHVLYLEDLNRKWNRFVCTPDLYGTLTSRIVTKITMLNELRLAGDWSKSIGQVSQWPCVIFFRCPVSALHGVISKFPAWFVWKRKHSLPVKVAVCSTLQSWKLCSKTSRRSVFLTV